MSGAVRRSLRLPGSAVVALVFVAAAAVRLASIHVIPETARVPVERLVANLERDLAVNPKNVQTWINLARLHGMAYALKTDEVPAARWSRETEYEPYYGADPDLIPYKPIRGTAPAADAKARRYLQNAIKYYERALALDPRSLLARLGYGWMLEQAGERSRAIAEYRQLIREAWVTEEHVLRSLPEDRYFTHEAAGYLISLLDPVRDADEIAGLRVKRRFLEGRPARFITPLVVPLEGDVAAEDIAARGEVLFDADGSGLRRPWTWISPVAGWLVHDPERLGRITSALQWFGSVSFWLFWENGYQALGALDDDRDGELRGEELRDLAIWHDRNTNGRSEAGEVRSLTAHRIVALSCRYVAGDGVAFAAFSTAGVRFADGSTRPSYDVIVRPRDTRLLTRR